MLYFLKHEKHQFEVKKEKCFGREKSETQIN